MNQGKKFNCGVWWVELSLCGHQLADSVSSQKIFSRKDYRSCHERICANRRQEAMAELGLWRGLYYSWKCIGIFKDLEFYAGSTHREYSSISWTSDYTAQSELLTTNRFQSLGKMRCAGSCWEAAGNCEREVGGELKCTGICKGSGFLYMVKFHLKFCAHCISRCTSSR